MEFKLFYDIAVLQFCHYTLGIPFSGFGGVLIEHENIKLNEYTQLDLDFLLLIMEFYRFKNMSSMFYLGIFIFPDIQKKIHPPSKIGIFFFFFFKLYRCYLL